MTTTNPRTASVRPTSPAFLVGLGLLIVAAIAAIVTALLLAFGGPDPAAVSNSAATWPQPAAVLSVQRELGQLNYYEGPDDGKLGPQTISAITYLQRDAKLPQTGQFDSATQAALANFIAHGNNQMGG